MADSPGRCAVCTRCGRCGRGAESPIADSGRGEFAFSRVAREGFGAAVDLGSTTLVARVYDLSTGECVRHAVAWNPQRAVASDVMGRISAATAGRLGELSSSVRHALNDLFGDFPIRECVIVGNTTMLHLLAGESPAPYAVAPFQARRFFGERIDLDGVPTLLPRCAHAFFGSDALAAIVASGLCSRPGPELFADIGTNGEIALWKNGVLTIASVAAGPAFERPGIRGSDLVAALADGLDSGVIDETGLVEGEIGGGVDQSDVRAVQLAKAAVSAGLSTLLRRTDAAAADVVRFTVAGGLGSALDLAKAARIGLFPPELLPVATASGNLAIEGAAAMLLDPSVAAVVDTLARTARHVELGGDSMFSDLFMSAISFPS